jgi:hypothetical protein
MPHLTTTATFVQALLENSFRVTVRCMNANTVDTAAPKMTVAAARKKFGSLYHIAKLLDRNISSVSRWGKYVPQDYVATLQALPESRLKRGGVR